MPYKSQAQHRKFRALEREGKLPKGTAREWAHHTPNLKTLPDRVGDNPKEGTAMQKIAAAAADAQMVEKLAHDTQITPALVRHLAGMVRMTPAAFVKAAYADPADYTIFLKVASGAVKAAALPSGAAGGKLVNAVLGFMQKGTQAAGNFGKGLAGKSVQPPLSGAGFGAGSAVRGAAGKANQGANNALARVGVTDPAAQRVGKIGAGTAAVGGGAGVANNVMKAPKPQAGAPEQPGAHEATVNNQIGGAQAAGMAQAAPQQPQQPPQGGLGTAGKALIAGGGAAIGALGVGAAMRRRKANKTVTAADVAKDVMRHAIVKKAADLYRKEAADAFVRGMDKVAGYLPLEKQAMIRKMQAAVAEGKPLSHAIKLAYPHLNGEQRGILATKLVKVACLTKRAVEDGLKFGRKTGRQEATVKMKDGAVGKMKQMSC